VTVVDLLLTIVTLGSVACTAALAAACLGTRTAPSHLLLTYTLVWAELLAIALVLSPIGRVSRPWLVAAALGCLIAALVVWTLREQPRPPSLRPHAGVVREALRDPALAILAFVVSCGWLYVLALAFFTPPLEWDSLTYHLPRAAFWLQDESVRYIDHANDARLNGNPPGGEIGLLWTMALSGGDRFVALPQLAAASALMVGVIGIAGRIGLSARSALLSALLFASLPLVAIQAPTTYNDLVVASFLVIAAYASLGRARSELVLLALAIALALMTKFTGILALPVLVLVAAVANPMRRWPALAGAGLAGIVLGSPWYVVNRVETGHLDGALTNATAQVQERTLTAIAPTIRREVYSFVDFSGTRGIDLFPSPPSPFTTLEELFGLLALLALVVGAAWGIGAGRTRRGLVLGAGAAVVVALPAALVVLGDQFLRIWHSFWVAVGRPVIAEGDSSWQWQISSDPALSWFGPLAASLLIVGTAIVARETWRRRFAPVAIVLAAAPLLFLMVFAVLVPWDPWRGRFFVFSIALAAATWGAIERFRPALWGAVTLAAVTLPLALLTMYTKPVAPWARETATAPPPFVWTTSRSDMLSYLAANGELIGAIAAVERAGSSTVAAALRENDFIYPYFGERRERRVLLVEHQGGLVPPGATWLVAAPGASIERCGRWEREYEEKGWVVERRLDSSTSPCEGLQTVGS
jgi:Dolichyl-phosphate-mannose-protein mannosyltransferase